MVAEKHCEDCVSYLKMLRERVKRLEAQERRNPKAMPVLTDAVKGTK